MLNTLQVNSTTGIRLTKRLSADNKTTFVMLHAPDWDVDFDAANIEAEKMWRAYERDGVSVGKKNPRRPAKYVPAAVIFSLTAVTFSLTLLHY